MATKTEAVAGRVRRPSWRDPRLLVGLVLMALAVVAVVTIVNRADTTEPFFAAAHDLAPGAALSDDDVVVVHVRVSEGEYVPGEQSPVGSVLDRAVGEGELIPASSLVSPDDFTSRAIAVESSMPLADGVGVGSLVDVWVTIEDDSGTHSSLVGSSLAVTDVREAEASLGANSGQTVYVAVPLGDVGEVLDAVSSDGEVAIVAAAGS